MPNEGMENNIPDEEVVTGDSNESVEDEVSAEKLAKREEAIAENPLLVDFIEKSRQEGLSNDEIAQQINEAGHYSEEETTRFMDAALDVTQDDAEQISEEIETVESEADTNLEESSSEGVEDAMLETQENKESIEGQIEKESALLSENMDKLNENTKEIDSMSTETLEKNEEDLNTLGEKLSNAFASITEKLSKMETNKLLVPGAIMGIVAIAMNIGGMSQLAEATSYLPDTIQQFLSSPESAGSLLWSIIEPGGEAFSLPTIDNFANQAQSAAEVFTEKGEHYENAARAASGMVNMATGMVVAGFSKGIGEVAKSWAQAKQKVINKYKA